MITQILLQQTIIMFALMLLGLLLSRRGMITEQGSRDLSNVLLYAVIPCVILRSYISEFSTEKLRAMPMTMEIKTGLTKTILRFMVSFLPEMMTMP